jgi:hypothetical protein
VPRDGAADAMDTLTTAFIRAIAEHRHWERAKDAVPA